MNPSMMQNPTHPQPQHPLPMARNQQQNNLALAVALAGLGTYAFYTSIGDMQTVIYTVGGAYVLRILLQNPEIMRQVQARVSALQSGRALHAITPMQLQGTFNSNGSNNASGFPRLDTSFNHPSSNGYQPLQAVNGGSGLYDDFENSMATPTTPDPHYAPLPPASRMASRAESGTSTIQAPNATPSVTIASASPTAQNNSHNVPSIGMTLKPGQELFNPRASVTSTFSAFAIPATNAFASYQHYDSGTINGERLLNPVSENDLPRGGPFDMSASLAPAPFDSRASIETTFSAFAIPSTNPFASYAFFDAGTIGGERVAVGTVTNETLSERIAAPPRRIDTAATITQEDISSRKAVSQSPYDAGAAIGQSLARRASRRYSGVTGAGLPGAGTLALVSNSNTSPTTPASAVSMNEYVPRRKHRQPTIAARVGEVAAPGGGIAPAPESPQQQQQQQSEHEPSPVIKAPTAPAKALPRPPTPAAPKRLASRPGAASPNPTPVPLPTTTRVELPARKSTVVPLNRTSSLNRGATNSPLRRTTSTSSMRAIPPPASPAPPMPRLMSPAPGPPIRFFDSPLVNSPVAPASIHPMSPLAPFVASSTAPFKSGARSASGYDSDSSHASSSTSSRRSQERQASREYSAMNSHSRTDSLGLPSYEKHATTIFTLVPRRPGYVPQIQAILKAARSAWLALPGTVSHEVGQDDATGSVVVVETYESSESMEDFEKSKERDSILARLSTFIDDSKTSVVRMPGSSAVTRLR